MGQIWSVKLASRKIGSGHTSRPDRLGNFKQVLSSQRFEGSAQWVRSVNFVRSVSWDRPVSSVAKVQASPVTQNVDHDVNTRACSSRSRSERAMRNDRPATALIKTQCLRTEYIARSPICVIPLICFLEMCIKVIDPDSEQKFRR